MARIRWHRREEDRLLRSARGPVGQDLAARAARVEAEQKRLAPVSADGSHGREPGYMRDSITARNGRDADGLYADIGPTAETPDGHPYPINVEFGSAPHVIRSKGDYPLRAADGRVFGHEVQHPGGEAQPFIRPSIEAARDR